MDRVFRRWFSLPDHCAPPPPGRTDLPKLETALETAKSEIAAELPKLTANKAHSAAVGALRCGAHVACACAFVFMFVCLFCAVVHWSDALCPCL